MDNELRKMIRLASSAREDAYVPYSHFSVGAALLTNEGEVVTGCNIENVSYPAGMCAERTAIFSAVAKKNRTFKSLVVMGGREGCACGDYCMPCGMCLQVMSEFCEPDFDVYIAKNENEVQHYTLKELLPHVFDSLNRGTPSGVPG